LKKFVLAALTTGVASAQTPVTIYGLLDLYMTRTKSGSGGVKAIDSYTNRFDSADLPRSSSASVAPRIWVEGSLPASIWPHSYDWTPDNSAAAMQLAPSPQTRSFHVIRSSICLANG